MDALVDILAFAGFGLGLLAIVPLGLVGLGSLIAGRRANRRDDLRIALLCLVVTGVLVATPFVAEVVADDPLRAWGLSNLAVLVAGTTVAARRIRADA